MYKNHEGYSSPTEGKAIAKVTREERTRMLEAKYGIYIGQILEFYFQERYEGPSVPGRKYIIRRKKLRVLALYPTYALLQYRKSGIRECFAYEDIEKFRSISEEVKSNGSDRK